MAEPKNPEMKTFIIRQYKHKELAALYGVHRDTFRDRCIKPIAELLGKRHGHYYSIPQVNIILQECGVPPGYTLL